MAVTTTNLGVITAYGDAVAAGYTGTKAEWQALMASYATVGQQAVDAKNAAVAAKDTAVAKATEATTAASTATTKASEASASAQSITQSAAQIQENTDDIDQLKSDLKFTTGVQGYSWVSNKTRYYSNPFVQVDETNWESALVSCTAGDRFRLKGYGGNNTRLWAFVDSEGTMLTMAAYAQVASDYIIIYAPENAAYLVVNSKYTEVKGELYKGEWLLPVVNKVIPLVYCKNLVGEDTTALYPTNLTTGESLTMSTSDGSPLNSGAVTLEFFDENKEKFDNWNFTNGTSQRTITNTKSKTAKYMRWAYIPSGVHLQVEYGASASGYQPYFVPDLTDVRRNVSKIENDILPLVYCKNLVGEDTTALYPTNLTTGESLTMSTSDGSPLNSGAVTLEFFDENKEKFDNWNFTNGTSQRTITNTKSKTAKYMRWAYIPSGVHLQVEYGSQATSYQTYFANVDALSDIYLTAADVFNGEPYAGAYDWQTPVVSYGALFKGKSNVESFAFFTDPHVMGFGDDSRNEPKMQNYFKRIQRVFSASPCGFMVSGGDWLNNSTTMDEACYRLGYLKGIATHLLDGCYLVMGNHDTNYQGKLDSESENFTGRLDDPTIASIMYRDTDTKKAYYSFDGSNSKCYVLDTGIEHDTVEAYDWEQVDWLAHRLIEDDAEHSIIFLHIIVNNEVVQANAAAFGTLIQAYNAHSSVTLNGITYNFSQCSGRMDFWAAGHTHSDSNGTLGGVPYFITGTNSYNSDVPLIDLALADYEARKLYLVRVGGTGTNRTISL